ncbi:MAG: hypothetical protein Q4B99_03110 [Clostridia bacterium]|nr:hypothetical protein [Clostridia bacterium]
MDNSKFIAVTCPACHSPMQAASGQDYIKCEYCDTVSYVPSAVAAANASASEFSRSKLEMLLRNGDTHLRLQNYNLAVKAYERASIDYPHDYRTWWGLVRARTNDLRPTPRFGSPVAAEFKRVEGTADAKALEELRALHQTYIRECALLAHKETTLPGIDKAIESSEKALREGESALKRANTGAIVLASLCAIFLMLTLFGVSAALLGVILCAVLLLSAFKFQNRKYSYFTARKRIKAFVEQSRAELDSQLKRREELLALFPELTC